MYLTNLRREKEAFEKLIMQKSHIAIPIDENGQVVVDSEQLFWKTSGQLPALTTKKILVDVREFRSSLPLLIHSRRIDIIPCTIEVGDYVLSPTICIERKAPSDLSQSLKSGRLYKQCQSMSIHYSLPILLIEYPQHSSFQLTFSGINNDLDTARRLCLLLIHFPKLLVIWSSSPAATAEIFEDLQRDQLDPDLEKAQSYGIESETNLGVTNQTPMDILMTIPGISFKNFQLVVARVKTIKELSELGQEELISLIGPENGRQVYNFFHQTSSVV